MLDILFAFIIGIIAGTFSGLIPGIHINLIGSIIISIIPFLLNYLTIDGIIIFLVAMAITHTFINFIPSIFLGAPTEDTCLSILPGHELLKNGYGYYAVLFSLYGSLYAIISILLISPIFIFLIPKFENIINFLIPFILLLSSSILILSEKQKLKAMIVFLLSGFLGISILHSNINQPFLPMLSGLFGVSSLLITLKSKTQIPLQKTDKIIFEKRKAIKPLIISTIISPLCCLFPGIGSGQSAIICSSIKKMNKKEFLILLGSINTIVIGISFVIFYSIGRTRTGVASTIKELTETLTINQVILILITILATGIFCFYYSKLIAKIFAKNINKLNYSKISIFIISLIFSLTFLFTGFQGILFLIISTSIGIFGILSNVKRTNLMGCLIIPVLLFYLL